MEKQQKENKGKRLNVWNWMDGFRGDKVILIIALLLMLISVISLFSSTPLLALQTGTDRIDIMFKQLKIVGAGVVIILLLYIFGRSGIYRWVGKYGFFLSLAMLFFLVSGLKIGDIIRPGDVNEARRVIMVFGKQLHVYEFVKVLMILYLAWALDAYKRGAFKFTKRLAGSFPKLSFLATPLGEKTFYIYLPILVSVGLVATGSNSSALFIAAVLILLILIGGINLKEMVFLGLGVIVIAGGLFLGYRAGLLEKTRIGTAISRITNDDDTKMAQLLEAKPGTKTYQKLRDELQQPVGAQLAIKEGGILGKGIGNSTQKYTVPVIFGDYMFSFIVEETGFLGAIFIILLYFSLLARGSLIAKDCDEYFDKMAVAGLSILVTGQAFMHMMVNVHFPLVPQTGQTLPLVSHGTTAFLVFSAVFGILLSISRQTYLKMKKREAEVARMTAHDPSDDIQAGLDDLDELDTLHHETEDYGV